MTMNSSGPISLAGTTAGVSIEIENGGNGTTQISLNCTAVRTLAGVPSGAITMPTNFYGKSNQFTYTVSANQTNFCMRAGAVSAGWNQSSKLVVNINSGVIISANSTGSNAMTIQGSFPNGVTVTNSGTIVGMGGGGGYGGGACCGASTCSMGRTTPSAPGGSGGTALKVSSAVTFNNVGTIAGGGGGGGGGASSYYSCNACDIFWASGGGGGGGRSSNAANSAGGAAGYSSSYVCASSGGSGTYSSAGGGGAGGQTNTTVHGGAGGAGGGWGSAGSTGANYSGPSYKHSPPSAGGGGGKATCGAGTYITWTGTGTRYGSVS